MDGVTPLSSDSCPNLKYQLQLFCYVDKQPLLSLLLG